LVRVEARRGCSFNAVRPGDRIPFGCERPIRRGKRVSGRDVVNRRNASSDGRPPCGRRRSG
jgi:hypothetical protein